MDRIFDTLGEVVAPMAENGAFHRAFKANHRLELRRHESQRMLDKYPDRVPVILDVVHGSQIPVNRKKKFLVPTDLTVGQFVHVVRKQIQLTPEKAVFVFVRDGNGKMVLPPTSSVMSNIYEFHKDEDNFLYILYGTENTFGGAAPCIYT